ncbi:MAG TPA: M48 family metallopeptidase [Steroidobacteraceae bacterium]|nr:M48 family metallopeptidase [Steroidobacteraceae bacterium]
MSWPTMLFIAAVVVAAVAELWLATRQIGAVTAHRDRIPEPFAGRLSADDHRKAADYTIAKARVGMVGSVIDAAVTLALTVGGGIAAIDTLWRHTGWGEPWLGIAVIGTLAAVVTVIGLPLSLVRTFRTEARFGFNRTTPLIFVADLGKGVALAALLGGPLVLAVLLLMEHAGRWWWLAAFGCWLVVTLLVTWAWPAFIAPLFNKFSPLEDASLRGRIEALLTRCGFRSSGVFVVDGSRRSAHGNAYFTGIGRQKRIVFFDTLLQQLAAAEIEAVLAHELGHFRLRHVRHRLIVSFVVMLVGFALLGWLAGKPDFYRALGVPTPSAHAALILFAMAVPVVTFFTTPLSSLWSRRHEFAADRFASQNASAQQLASALVKLYRDNASTLTPDPLYTAFYYSHPPALERIARLTAAAPATS